MVRGEVSAVIKTKSEYENLKAQLAGRAAGDITALGRGVGGIQPPEAAGYALGNSRGRFRWPEVRPAELGREVEALCG